MVAKLCVPNALLPWKGVAMSRAASLLTTADVPKYIRGIASRLRETSPDRYTDDCVPGYTFDLYGKWKIGFENQLYSDCEKLLKWCQSWHAEAHVVSEHFWAAEVAMPQLYDVRGSRGHRQKAYREGYRNHIRIVITDPVAHRFERDGFYRN